MEAPFMIIRTFLKNLEFRSLNTPGLFFSNDSSASATLGVSIDVQAKVAEETSLFMVDLVTRITPQVKEQAIFDIHLTYSALVELDTTLDEDTRKKILQVLVPQNLHDPLRALVWNITTASGFSPLMLKDFDFMSNTVNASDINNLPLGYNWIIKNIQSMDDGAEFMQTLILKGGVDISCYEELPLYKYYYRFIQPIKYHHPEVECEESYWDILFQLIFAEGEEPKIIEGTTEQLPEIEVGFEGERNYVSNLSIEELQSLTSYLAVQAFSHSMVEIIGASVDDGYADQIDENNPVLKEELLTLYNCNQPYANTDAVAFVDQIYERIKECDLQTFPYKL